MTFVSILDDVSYETTDTVVKIDSLSFQFVQTLVAFKYILSGIKFYAVMSSETGKFVQTIYNRNTCI